MKLICALLSLSTALLSAYFLFLTVLGVLWNQWPLTALFGGATVMCLVASNVLNFLCSRPDA